MTRLGLRQATLGIEKSALNVYNSLINGSVSFERVDTLRNCQCPLDSAVCGLNRINHHCLR